MKKLKKPFSLLLAAIMALSVCTVGFTAFAAEPSVEEQIEKASKLTDELKEAYNALPEDEKDAMKVQSQAKIQYLAYSAATKNAAGKNCYNTAKMEIARELVPLTAKQRTAAQLAAVMNGNASFQVNQTVYHRDVMNKIKATTFEKDIKVTTKSSDEADGQKEVTVTVQEQIDIVGELIDQYGDLTGAQKDLISYYTTGWNTTTSGSSDYGPKYSTYVYVSSVTPTWKNATDVLLTLSANAITATAAEKPTAAELEKQVVAAMAENQILSTDANAALAEFCKMSAAYTALAASKTPTEEQIQAYETAYKAFGDLLKNTSSVIAAASKGNAAIINENGKSVSLSNFATHADYKNQTLAFERYMLDVQVPDVANEKAAALAEAVKTEYNKIKSAARSYISASASEKKDAIDKKAAEYRLSVFQDYVMAINVPADDFRGSVAFNAVLTELSETFKALDAVTKKAAKADETLMNRMKKLFSFSSVSAIADTHEMFEPVTAGSDAENLLESALSNTVIPGLNNIVEYALNAFLGSTDIEATLRALFTNGNVTAALKALYPMLDSAIGSGTFRATPGDVASYLPATEQFNEAKQVLAGIEGNNWDNVPADLNWNVVPGDYDMFMNALLNALNPLAVGSIISGYAGGYLVNSYILKPLLNTYETYDDGSVDYSKTTFGAWEYAIVPLFESLGITNVINSIEYTAKVSAAGSKPTLSDYVRPLMDEIYNKVVPTIVADPAGWLMSNLPNFLYHLQDNCILEGVWKWLNPALSLVKTVAKLDVKQMLKDLLAVEGVAPDEVNGDAILNFLAYTVTNAGVQFSYDDLMDVAHMGTPTAVPTQRQQYASIIRVEADKESLAAYLAVLVNDLVKNIDLGGITLDFTPINADFVKREAPGYPHNGKMGKDVIRAMINGLDSLVGGFVNINDLINSGLCTQEMAANAITAIYPALNGALSALGVSVSPKQVAKMMEADAKYADVVEALQLDSWDDVGLVIKNDDTVFLQVNMGFKDGDRQGFFDCLVAALRPIVREMANSGLLVNSAAKDGSTVYGLYETVIIPLFEALGLTPAANSETYTDNYTKLAQRNNPNESYDYLIRTILSPVLTLLDDVAAAPVATLMKLLPNLAYAVQHNPQLAFVGNLLNAQGGLAAIVNGLLRTIQTGKAPDETPIYGLAGFELPPMDLDALASCGTVKELKSKRALYETYTGVVADEANAFVTVFYYLYNAMNYKDNMQIVKTLLAGIDGMDATISALIDNVLNQVFTKGKEEALCMLGTLLASDVWECPNEAGNDGSATPSTGDYAVPAGAFLVMMLAAGGAIFLLRKKKALQ